MRIRTKLLITTILVIMLPFCVTIATWQGLLRMDIDIQRVAEEFTEARSLQPIDADLKVAIFALRQENSQLERHVLDHLEKAETTLLKYLAEQYDSDAGAEHQANESLHASKVLTELRHLIGPEWDVLAPADRLQRALGIQEGIRRLYDDAESGVIGAQQAARLTRQHTMQIVLTVSLATALSCILLSIWSNRSVIIRLRELHRNVAMRSEGTTIQEPVDVSTAMNQINELSERMYLKIQEKSRELLRRERMAGIGLLAADVAHEINNPMNAMLGLSELSLRTTEHGPINDDAREELHESLTVIKREALRCKVIVERLMAMVRCRSEPHWFDVMHLLVETVDIAKASRPDKADCFHLLGNKRPIQLFAPSQEVRQIILTLLINAADAVSDVGRIEVDATQSDQEVWLRVRDNGRGFTPEMQLDFPVAFRTSRAEEGGMGLGLSIAYALSIDIGAELRSFSDGLDKGSLFLLAISSTVRE